MREGEEAVCAVVVTHNRLALLRECLEAVLGQTHPPDHVLVVDNASTDATPATLAAEFPSVEVLRLETNEGSSGGFHAGMEHALRARFGWLWVMDDDTIPSATALERLLAARGKMGRGAPPDLLYSRVVWTDGTIHPINYPGINVLDMDDLADSVERGLLPLRWATFPSLLVRADAVRRHGAPRPHYFIWSDDIDFTARILRDGRGYFVPDSVATHKTPAAHNPWEGGDRFYFAVRNGLYVLRGGVFRPEEAIGWSLLTTKHTYRYLRQERFRPHACLVVLRGLRDGLRPLPARAE